MHRFTLKIWLVSLLLCACAGQAKRPEAPAVPVPPREPLAWLPQDASFAGHVLLGPFRDTPLWPLWEQVQQDPAAQASLIEASKIEGAAFAGSDTGNETASFVAAVFGVFAADSVATLARARGIVPEAHGLLTFFRVGQVAYAQVYPELILVCSLDRIEATAQRAAQGDAVKIRETPLFRSLAPRLLWGEVDFAMIAEDPRGEVKARAEQRAQRYGLAFSSQDIVRAGAALKLGPTASLRGAIEATGDAQAEALKVVADGALANLESNLFIGLLGLRPLIKTLASARDGSYVAVSGNVAADDLNRALDRLAGMLGVALSQAGTTSAPAPSGDASAASTVELP